MKINQSNSNENADPANVKVQYCNEMDYKLFIVSKDYLVLKQTQLLSSGSWLNNGCSFLSHSSDIDDLLEGLDGVLEDWLDGLHDTESSLHIVDLGLHTFDGLHLSGDLDEWLSVIESLEDSSGKSLMDVLDGSGLGNGGIGINSGLGGESGGEG